MSMKRTAVIMALLCAVLLCSTSVLASTPMDGHFTVNTQVTDLGDGFYRYDYAITNVDQGTAYIYQGMDVFIIQVPLTATLREITDPAVCPSDPCNDSNGTRYWIHGTVNGPLTWYPYSGETPQSGYQWLWWAGQNTCYPQGTTAHFSIEVNAPPGSNPGLILTYQANTFPTPYTYGVFQGNFTGPVIPTPLNVELELLYPVGASPKVFTRGWLFGAKCIDKTNEPEQDLSSQVEWSGTGSFESAKGSSNRPTFAATGSNTITLSITVGGETVKKDFTVEAVSPDKYARLGSLAHCPADAHQCQLCPHNVYGPVISGSPTVSINGKPAARKGDPGRHAWCCGPNTFVIDAGDPEVLIDGKPAARIGDKTIHCGGVGKLIASEPASATQAVQSLLLMQ
jgi:uncharacterized Zn-binding protein involved in type VI secretion